MTPRRNLLYHVWPVRGSMWRWNVAQLVERIDLFNGRRLVAVVHDARSEPPEAVEQALDGHGCEVIALPNSPEAEATTFPEMLARLVPAREQEGRDVTFYGHAKGVKYDPHVPPQVRQWAQALYRTCLDDWLSVREQLATAALTGAFKRHGRFGAHRFLGAWHYSGTFFWMNDARVGARGPLAVPRFYGGVEAWPGIHFRSSEAAALFLHDLRESPYSKRFWSASGRPQLQAWEARLRRLPPPDDLRHPRPFGGGDGPRAEQKPEELGWWIEELLASDVRRLLVIGSLHGGVEWHTARVFREHARDLTITAVDVALTPQAGRAFEEIRARFGQQARQVRGDAANPDVQRQLDARYDAVFIDAAHGYRDCRRHWLLARAVGARRVGFHDIVDSDWHAQNRCCVSRLWAEIRDAGLPTAERASGEWGGIGVVRL